MQLYNKYATQDAGFCLPVYIRFQKPPIGASPRFVSQQATGSRLAVFVSGVPMGFIYLIRCNEFYKIGVSETSVAGRLEQLQTGNPYRLELIAYFELQDLLVTERKLHNMLSAKHTRGEWFQLVESDIERIREYISQAGGVEKQSLDLAEKITQLQPMRAFGTVPQLRVSKGFVMWEWETPNGKNKAVRHVEVLGKVGEVDMNNPPLPTLY